MHGRFCLVWLKESFSLDVMKLSHLNALRALEATLRLGNFSAAAMEIGITPAAVGQRVRALEDYLGRPLFERSGTGAVARPEARQVARGLNGGFAAIAEALEQLKAQEASQRLRVTLPESFAENWLSWSLSQFQRDHPVVELDLDASNRDVDLMAEDFDLAVRYGSEPGEDYDSRLLFGDAVLPVCAPDFARAHAIDGSARDLSEIPLIHVLNRTGDPDWVGFREWGARFEFAPADMEHGVRFSKTSSGLQAAVSGQGLIMAGMVEAYHGLRIGQLVAPFGAAMTYPTAYAYRILWDRRKRLSKAAEAFVTWLLQQAEHHEQECPRVLGATSD